MAKKIHQRTGDVHKDKVKALLLDVGLHKSLWQVFRDFVALAALDLSAAADPGQRADRDVEAAVIRARYTDIELSKFHEAFAHVVMGLEERPHDFLGSLYMLLELGDAWKGQFFTPYEVCLLMAKINLIGASEQVAARGFIVVNDPCVGGGAMLIAMAQAMREGGINYQRHMHAVAQDIDITAVHMAYVQLSLLYVPAVVLHANSLTPVVWSTWRTIAHTRDRWHVRLDEPLEPGAASRGIPEPTATDLSAHEQASVVAK